MTSYISSSYARSWRLVALVALSILLPTASFAATGYSYLAYTPVDGKLQGYSVTSLDPWERVPYVFIYSPCECEVTRYNVAELGAALFDPGDVLQLSAPPAFGLDAIATLTPWSPLSVGAWKIVGFHYVVIDYYMYGSHWFTHRAILGSSNMAADVACLVPTGETTTSIDWKGEPFPTVHDFKGSLLSSTPGVSFSGMQVEEFQPPGKIDQCWDSRMPANWQWGLSGGTWTVGVSNEWGPDSVGVEPALVEGYQATRVDLGLPLPCSVTVPQQMKIAAVSCSTMPVYKSHTLGIESVRRASQRVETTYRRPVPGRSVRLLCSRSLPANSLPQSMAGVLI